MVHLFYLDSVVAAVLGLALDLEAEGIAVERFEDFIVALTDTNLENPAGSAVHFYLPDFVEVYDTFFLVIVIFVGGYHVEIAVCYHQKLVFAFS